MSHKWKYDKNHSYRTCTRCKLEEMFAQDGWERIEKIGVWDIRKEAECTGELNMDKYNEAYRMP